jgi:hypothetical protein
MARRTDENGFAVLLIKDCPQASSACLWCRLESLHHRMIQCSGCAVVFSESHEGAPFKQPTPEENTASFASFLELHELFILWIIPSAKSGANLPLAQF